MESEHHLTFTIRSDGWVIEGELDRQNAASLRAWCERIHAVQDARTLELGGLDILDSDAVAAAIDAIRLLLQRTASLTVAHAPHLLSHTLYRLGMLEAGSRLALFEPRQEEPYG
jgi:ABC-type transporter Mla MlaB component